MGGPYVQLSAYESVPSIVAFVRGVRVKGCRTLADFCPRTADFMSGLKAG